MPTIIQKDSNPYSYLRTNKLYSLLLGLTVFLLGSQVFAQDVSDGRFYLRYQGTIEAANEDLASTIDCVFEFLDSSGTTQHRERHSSIVVVNQSFTVTLGAEDNVFDPNIFSESLKLLTMCDLDRNGSYEVSITEAIGSTPKAAVAFSVKGPVEASYIRVNGSEVVSPDGEWLGSVVTDQDLRAESLAVTSANITTDLTTSNAYIGDLSLSTLSYRPTLENDSATQLINNEGTWVGNIILPDLDNDGVADWIENLLGSDPTQTESVPLDENDDGIFDLLQGDQEDTDTASFTLPFDENSFSHTFTLDQSTQDFTSEAEGGVTWTAAQIEVTRNGTLNTFQINFTVQHPSGIHLTQVELELPNGDLVTLIPHDPNVVPPTIQTERSYQFSAANPPEGQDWSTVTHIGDEPRTIQGLFKLKLTNYSGDATTPTITDFSLQAEYISSDSITLHRDIDLRSSARLFGVTTPSSSTDAVPKSYVDQSVSELNDRIQDLQRNFDPTYPSRFTYRYRDFEIYDVDSDSYILSNFPELFGGITTNDWGTTGVTASVLDINQLNALLTEERQAGNNALILNKSFSQSDEAQGFFAVVHTQIENTSDAVIPWIITPQFSCDNQRLNTHQKTSIAINGIDIFSSESLTCNSISTSATINIDFPANQVSNLTFVISASVPNTLNQRRLILALTGNDLSNLPAGLIYRKLW